MTSDFQLSRPRSVSRPPEAASSREKDGASPRTARWADALRAVAPLVVVAATVSSARASLADHYVVPSGSMRPTLVEGDRIVVDKRAFGLRLPFTELWLLSLDGPARGDVVVLRSPEDGATLVKRVMGLPGETISVRDGLVLVGGEPVEEAHQVVPFSIDYGPTKLGEAEYLVLGDNRGNSHDGRAFGPVSRDQIYGRVAGVVWRNGHFTWRPL